MSPKQKKFLLYASFNTGFVYGFRTWALGETVNIPILIVVVGIVSFCWALLGD